MSWCRDAHDIGSVVITGPDSPERRSSRGGHPTHRTIRGGHPFAATLSVTPVCSHRCHREAYGPPDV